MVRGQTSEELVDLAEHAELIGPLELKGVKANRRVAKKAEKTAMAAGRGR